MSDVTIDFAHQQTTHCETGAMINLLRFHGVELSEPMAFGIGGGLFFGYFPLLRMAHIRVTTFRRMPGTLIRNGLKRLGVNYQTKAFSNPKKARLTLDRLLDQGIPVACQAGFFWLPYVPRAMRSHFNAHNIVIYGRHGDEYLVSEPGMDQVQTIHYADLERARFAKGGLNPRGRMYWLTKDRSHWQPDLAEPIIAGLKDTCFFMLDIPLSVMGVRGIHHLARDLVKWKRSLTDEEVKNNLNQVIIMQEVVGSGGGGFRFMFAAFLAEASNILSEPDLARLSQEMTALGDQWREFALIASRYIKNRSQVGGDYENLVDRLHELANQEEIIYRRLREIIKNIKKNRS
jgi:hypothetical protein